MRKLHRYFQKIRYLLFFILILVPNQSKADSVNIIGEPGKVNVQGSDRPSQIAASDLGTDLQKLWGILQNYVYLLGGIAILYIIWNGIRYITAQGDAKKVQEARQAIVQAVLAIALIVGATIVVSAIWALARVLATGATFVAS